MRGTRGLLLLAIAAILGGLAATYYHQRKTQALRTPSLPRPLAHDVEADATDWHWSRNSGGHPGVELRARHFRHFHDPERVELDDIELRLYHQDGRKFDLVRCAHAVFDPARAMLSSAGEAEILMGVRSEGAQGRLLHIRASGVTFDSAGGRVSTEQPARFVFDQGEGSAVGASYDPASGELIMQSEAELIWRGRGPRSRPMKLQAGRLVYREKEGLVALSPWSRLIRGGLYLEAADAIVRLQQAAIREVEANRARGQDQEADRKLEYSADKLWMLFRPQGELEKLKAEGNACVVSQSESGSLSANAERVELEFDVRGTSSVLAAASAMGRVTLVSEPLARPGAFRPETRRLESDFVQLYMRVGGREIERVETASPGRLEFLPNRPDQRRRLLEAERLWIYYGQANRLRSLRAVKAKTRTEAPASAARGAKASPVETESRDLIAEFDPQSGELVRLEQWNDFHYREGAREGRAERAVLEESARRILMEKSARVWDESSAVSADGLVLDQQSGDVVAKGRVASSHRPERRPSSAVLSAEQSVEAQADNLRTSDRRQKLFYEGHVVMWQGTNRLQAHQVEIDRRARRLTALGEVRTQVIQQPKEDSRPGRAGVFVFVEAPRLVYSEQERLAHYTGGVRLRRGNLQIEAAELQAWLQESGSGAYLDRAVARGAVRVLEVQPAGTRRASAEQAEYYPAEERIILHGGNPVLADSRRGEIRGVRLHWSMREDSWQVEGSGGQPALGRVRRP